MVAGTTVIGLALLLALGAGCRGSVAGTPDGAADAAADAATDAGPGADSDAGPSGDDGAAPTEDGGGDPADAPAADDGGPPDAGGDGADGGGDDGGASACAPPPTFAQGLSPSRELHVAQNGSDTDGDGSPERPYATIERAARQAQPGTAVVIHAGTYPGGSYLENLRGEPGAPIWLGGAPGEARPLISGGGQALHLVRPRYLVVHDLEAAGGSQNGINCDDGGDYADPEAAHHVVFRNLDIHDVGGDGNQDCLKLSGLNDFWVLDSRFARCGGGGSGSGIDHVGCHRGQIRGNRFEQNSGNAIQAKGGSTDLDITGNLMLEPGERGVNMGGSTGFQYFRPPLEAAAVNAEARRIRVQANIIVGGTAALAFVGCVDCLAANNTIVGPRRWLLRILQETVSDATYTFAPCSQNAVVNNIFRFERSVISTHINIGPDTAPDSFAFSHNLWFAADSPGDSQPALPAAEDAGLYGQDPLFDDPTGGDYHLGAGSPATGSGTSWPGLVGADFAGTCYGTPPDRGALAGQ